MANCYHSGCKCNDATVERAGQNFCSNACADKATQGSLAEAMCSCGHPECAAQISAS